LKGNGDGEPPHDRDDDRDDDGAVPGQQHVYLSVAETVRKGFDVRNIHKKEQLMRRSGP